MLGLLLEFSRCSLRTWKAQCVVWVWVVPGQVVGRGSCGPGATGLCRVYWAGEEMVPWAGPWDTVEVDTGMGLLEWKEVPRAVRW